jgi:cell fate regulator YaaT (PSP1 superfamily)
LIFGLPQEKEEPMKVRARELAIAQKTEMNFEFQETDQKPLLLYRHDRVDFRLLIKDFAKEFSTRVEMKQVFPSRGLV